MHHFQSAISRCRVVCYPALLSIVLICLKPSGAVQATDAGYTPQDSSCSDSIKDCKKPVKFISQTNGCYAFACEYGKATQKVIHVSDVSDVKKLLQTEKEDGN
jgi:hypothetical protein